MLTKHKATLKGGARFMVHVTERLGLGKGGGGGGRGTISWGAKKFITPVVLLCAAKQ